MAVVFSKQRFGSAGKTTTEQVKKIFQNPEHSKKYLFPLNVSEMWCREENTVNKIEENEP